MRSKFKWIFTLLLALTVQFSFAQEKTITGVVTDATGPLPGVNVVVKGTNRGVSTGFDGSYSIKAKEGETLTYSFMGMREVSKVVGASNTINTVLQDDSKVLGEVVVTAMGIKKQDKALGYAVGKVDGGEVAKGGNQNLLNSLAGKVAGVNVISSGGAPGMASSLVIRGGNKSITNSNDPLYVIDGVPITNVTDGNRTSTVNGYASPNRASDINPNDIETITVLKGAAGAVLYGNRGSNGVVVITTKSGKSKSGKATVDFVSNFAIDDALVLPDYQTVYAQGTNGITYQEGTSRSFGPKITGQTVNSTAAGAALGLGPQPVVLKAYDPRKDFLKTGVTINNNISISGGTEKYNAFFSVGQSKQTSIVPNQGFDKFNARFNGNFNLSEKFSVGANLAMNNSSGDMPFTGQDGNNPFFSLFHMPVSWNLKQYGYQRPDGRQINFRGGSFDNPLWSVNKNFARTESKRFLTNANASYGLTKWLKLSYRIGNDYLIDDINLFKDKNTGGNPQGALDFTRITRNEITSTLLAALNTKLTSDLGLTFTLGQDFNERTAFQSQILGTELIFAGIANTANVKTFSPSSIGRSKRNLFGVFGDFSLSYKNYLYLNLVARNEWSSTLSPDNRSFFYPGASASVVFTDALDIKSDVLSYGKFRAGYSKTGRDAPVYYTNTAVYNVAVPGDGFTPGITFPFGTLPGFESATTFNNPNLKPEFTTEYELGLDLRFLKDRLNLDLSVYKNINTQGIIPLDISSSTGGQRMVINSGQTSTKGIEASLRTTPIHTNSFRWDFNLNFNAFRSNVDQTYPGVDQIYLGGFSGNPAIFAVKGQPYGTIIGSGYDRDANGNILVDDDGYPLIVGGKNLGKIEPDWTGTVNTTFEYKGVYLSAQADARMGGYIWNGTEELLDFYGVTEKTLSREEDYIYPGVNSTTGQANNVVLKRNQNWYGNLSTEEYTYKNDWLKLRELSLGYRFKLKDIGITNLDINLFGRNLYMWTKVPHVDPESSSFGSGNSQGATRFAFPTTRTLGMSLKMQF